MEDVKELKYARYICGALRRYGRSGDVGDVRDIEIWIGTYIVNSVSHKGYWLTDWLTYLLSDRTDYRDDIASKNIF